MNSYSTFNIITRNNGPDTNSISYVNSLAKNYIVDICGGTAYSNLAGITSYSLNARGINPGNQGNTYLGIKNGANVLTTSNFASSASKSFTIYVKSASRFNTSPILGHGYALTTNALTGGYVIGNTLTISYYSLYPMPSTYTISGTVTSSDLSGAPLSGNITSNYLSLVYNLTHNSTKTFNFNVGSISTNLQLLYNVVYFTGPSLSSGETIIVRKTVTSIQGFINSKFPTTVKMIIFESGVNLTDTNTDYAFYNLRSLNTIIFSNMTGNFDLGYLCFYYCTSLTSITLPPQVTSINGSNCFNNCALTSLVIPNTVTSFTGLYPFVNCNSLTSLTLPSSVTTLTDSMFSGAANLRSIYTSRYYVFSATSLLNNAKIYNSSNTLVPYTIYTTGQTTPI